MSLVLKYIDTHVHVTFVFCFDGYTFYVTAPQCSTTKTFKKWPKLNATSTLAHQLMQFLCLNENFSLTILNYSLPSIIRANKNNFELMAL